MDLVLINVCMYVVTCVNVHNLLSFGNGSSVKTSKIVLEIHCFSSAFNKSIALIILPQPILIKTLP